MKNSSFRYGLTKDEWVALALSVGTHRNKESLSPSEVGQLIKKALLITNKEELANALGLRQSTMLSRFMTLMELNPKLHSVITFGSKIGKVGFSTAIELIQLNSNKEIKKAFEAAIKYNFSKQEAIQIKQSFKRGFGSIEECIEATLKTRPRIDRREVILGAIIDKHIEEKVNKITLRERDILFERVLSLMFPNISFLGSNLNVGYFSLVLDSVNSDKLKIEFKETSIEEMVTEGISKCI